MNLFQSARARIAARLAETDKSVLTNLAFLSAIALSTLLLSAVLAVSWWSDNFAPAVEVNGVSISVGEAKSRGEIANFRLNLEAARIRARVSAGTLTNEEADAFLQNLSEASTNLSSQLTSDMIDALLVAQLAGERNVAIDQAAIDAAWADETATPELRLLRRISIAIAKGSKGVPTEATIAAAQQKADAIIAEIKAGGDVGAIAKRDSSDAYASEGGRIGWSTKAEDPLTDPAYAAAWALTAVGPTEVISQSTDQLAIFYVDQIRPAQVDPNFELSATDAKINMDLYKKIVGERALSAALSEVVTAELLVGPVEQRDISYIAVPVPEEGSEAEEVLVRHLLYSPNDDSRGAAKLEPTDPAWAAAEAEANAAYEKIAAGTSAMASLADQSDDTGSGESGGLLGWAAKGSYVSEFETAVWADGLQVGDLLGPVKTKFGYHVMQFEGRRVGMTLRMEILAQELAGASVAFDARAAEALKEFEGMTTDNLGFTSRYSLNAQIGSAAWSLAAGAVSSVQTLNSQMVIFKVNAIEVRALTEEQKATIKSSGYLVWLDTYRQTAEIAIDGSVVQATGGSLAP